MSKPFACGLIALSLVLASGCIAAEGTAQNEVAAMRDGPGAEKLKPVSDGDGRGQTEASAPAASDTSEADDQQAPAPPIGKTYVVVVGATAYHPSTLHLHVGDKVDFVWQEGVHSVTSGFRCKHDAMFTSGTHPSPTTFHVSFLRTGVFPYFSEPDCISMSGLITVTEP